jgi:DNA-directed RNA polymerase specialized sigma24 family protein
MRSAQLTAAAERGRASATREQLTSADRRARNQRLLTAVLERSRALLISQARRHSQLPDDAEEALQSACILFIERYEERFRPLPWLQTTVKREAWRIANRAHRRRELAITAAPRADGQGTVDLSDAFPDPDADPLERTCRRQLTLESRAAFVESLKPDQRTALLLLGLGCSYAEIARSCGWTLTKVNRCLAEGRAALRASVTEP